MEYVDGGSLRPAVGTLSLEQIAGVIEGVLAGLAHAERRGVVHRDLKPENLLVTDEGLIKIADFDIAKAIDRTALGESLTATRIDAATGDWTTIDMPTTSKNGYGFAVGDGAVWALDRQHGILYGLDRRTGQPEGDGLQLGGPAIDAVATGGTVDVLMESKTPGRSTPARRCSSTASGFRRGRSGSSSRAPSSSSRSRATASRPTSPDPCAGRSSSTSAGRGITGRRSGTRSGSRCRRRARSTASTSGPATGYLMHRTPREETPGVRGAAPFSGPGVSWIVRRSGIDRR